ncbi:MAG: MarR family transcriptional regulator [Chloroflexi bacterium]|nr:MarR family transcriptional regulator [Chloroflexota bacterium]
MNRPLDEEQAKGWREFVQTFGTVMHQLDQHMQTDQDMLLAWFDVLAHLIVAPEGRLRMHELAESLVLVPSSLTRLIDRMCSAGLVKREPCPEDRRVVYCVITPAGQAAYHRVSPGHSSRVEERFMCYLNREDVKALRRIFSKVREAKKG